MRNPESKKGSDYWSVLFPLYHAVPKPFNAIKMYHAHGVIIQELIWQHKSDIRIWNYSKWDILQHFGLLWSHWTYVKLCFFKKIPLKYDKLKMFDCEGIHFFPQNTLLKNQSTYSKSSLFVLVSKHRSSLKSTLKTSKN